MFAVSRCATGARRGLSRPSETTDDEDERAERLLLGAGGVAPADDPAATPGTRDRNGTPVESSIANERAKGTMVAKRQTCWNGKPTASLVNN